MTYAQTTPNTAVLLRRNAMLATSLTQTAAPRRQANSALTVRPLTATDETEVLEFLAARPLHTVILVGREMLFEQRWPVAVREAVEGLRLATEADLELVAPVQAELAYEESGVNPLEKDPEGFRRRCARRIEQGRVWIWVEEGRLIFKTDIISETEDVTYLEGIWVNPQERGQGLALRCMAQLGRTLLQKTKALSILVNERNAAARHLYR